MESVGIRGAGVAGSGGDASFPRPTEALGLERLWLQTLPARALTVLSVVVFLAILVGLTLTPASRVLFRLPASAPVLAMVAAALAVLVAWKARQRPGRLAPRLWPLLLAGGSALLGLLATSEAGRDRPTLHILIAASLGAALVLALRLARPSPSRRGGEVAILLGALLAASWALVLPWWQGLARAAWTTELRAAIEELGELDRLARATFGGAEIGSEARWEEAATRLDRLAQLSPRRFLARPQLRRAARALGLEAELSSATGRAIEATIGALTSDLGPSLRRLAWPPYQYDRDRKLWLEDPRFGARARVVENHYREHHRLLLELFPSPSAGSEAAALGSTLASAREQWDRRLEELRDDWVDGWAVSSSGDATTLEEVLAQPALSGSFARSYRPIQLWNLMSVSAAEGWAIGGQPGCLRHRYSEENRTIQRTDCFVYGRRSDGGSADLRMEVRLVFETREGAFDLSRLRPSELYFLFPIPIGQSTEAYQAAVMTTFTAASQAAHPSFAYSADRSGTALRGFRLSTGGWQLRVHSHLISFVGNRQAVGIRVFWQQEVR